MRLRMRAMAECKHWFVIEPPHGTPTVRGICKFCGHARDFPTVDDTSIWDGRGASGFGQYRKREPEPVAEVNSW